MNALTHFANTALQATTGPGDPSGAGAAAAAAAFLLLLMVWGVIALAAIVGMWKVFAKAGQPGWAAIIPVYNIFVLTKTVGRPGWWTLLTFIPFVGIVVQIVLLHDLALSFGKDILWTLGLIFLGPVMWLVLGFGSARYVGPAAGSWSSTSSY